MKKRKEIITLSFGILAALFILVGQANYYQVQLKAIQEVDMQDSEENSSEEVLRIFSNDAVSSAVHFHFNQVLHFITNIYSEIVEEIRVYLVETLPTIDFFETLFRRIISPNAP